MVKQVIRDFLTNRTYKNYVIADDESLLESKMLDSLLVAELVIYLESLYGVTFDNDELTPENLDTIQSITDLLKKKGVK